MKPEKVETHLSAKMSKGKRTASESVDDGRPRKKKKNEKRKMEADGNKKEKSHRCSKPVQEPNISSSGSLRAELGSRPDRQNNGEEVAAPTAGVNQLRVDENNNSSFANYKKKQEVDWLKPIEESDSESRSLPNPNTQKTHKEKHHRSKSRRMDKQQGDTDQEKPQRRVCELPVNSLEIKSKKSKDCEKEIKAERSEEGENDQGGTKKSTTEKKRKKDHLEKDKSKKKVKIEQTERKTKDNKKDKEEDNKWKWWEEGHTSDGRKWSSLEHHGPLFPPPYEPLPSDVHFYYDGELLKLSLATEEVATFYAKMLDHEYTSKPVFQENFFSDWREEMTSEEKALIRKLSKCDFTEISKYFLLKSEERKAMTKEEKKVLKEEASQLTEEYGFCVLDGHREKIGNFRVEPPGLFRGRGEHPKMGKLKRRVQPEDISINCSKDSKIPAPPEGHKWKKVQHDDTVTWLASWVENVQGNIKYVMLNPSSKLKGEKDWQKYEVARKLKERVSAIRRRYREDWKDREMKTRQRGVALYFIDKLALRAGNEKEESETADTVGCCSLRVEHIKLHPLLDDQENVVEFDFLGKDSIRYYNKVPVEGRVFKNLKLFMENKDPEDDLFDRINTAYLNKHLNQAMPGLTAKVFRTFNASTTLQEQLNQLTSAEMSLEEKLLSYNRANRAVAILCNHQRAAPKTFEKSMQLLQDKISQKEQQLEAARKELKAAKKDHKREQSDRTRRVVEKKEAAVKRLEEQLKKLILQMTDREENKVIALGTSKLNYLDPRISVAWCKKFNVPIEKIYNKTQREKFAWAIDMTDDTFTF